MPAIEGRPILAVSFLSVKFPSRAPAGTALVARLHRRRDPARAIRPRRRGAGDLVRRELGDLIGASGDPLFMRVGRHPRSMPQYILGHLDRVAAIRRERPGTRGCTWPASPSTASASPTASGRARTPRAQLLLALADPAAPAAA